MRAEKLPATAGLQWLQGGFRLYRKNPGLLNFLWFSTWSILIVLSLLPLIGQAIGSLVMPGLLVGIFNGCRAIERGEKATPGILFSGFAASRPSMIRIGVVYLAVSTLVFAASLLLFGSDLQAILSNKEGPADISPEQAAQLLKQLLITLQVSTLLSLPALVAAPLAAWHRLPVGKALFFASVGILRNLLSIGVLYALLLMLLFGLPWVLSTVLSGMPDIIRTVGQLALMFLLAFVLMPTALASFYLGIRDIFQTGGNEQPD